MRHLRDPEKVLSSLSNHSKDPAYHFERLYRILFNQEMFAVAYQNIYANEGNMTKGSDDQTIDGMSLKRIEALIEALKFHPEGYISPKRMVKSGHWVFHLSMTSLCRKCFT